MAEAAWYRLERDVVQATGPEAAAFLQGQLSQDVSSLVDGQFAWSFLLAPTGKVEALLRVVRRGPEEWYLDTDEGWGERVVARLSRFRLRTRVDLALAPVPLFGWRESSPPALPGGLVLCPPWPGLAGSDVLALEGTPAVASGDPARLEGLRVEAGIPRMGAEMDERTIPGETGLVSMTVSFTKGCYTGQELVARIDSRGGNVPRRLARLRAAVPVEAGAELAGPQGVAASVTSSAPAAGSGGWVGLGYVRRGTPVPGVLRYPGSGAEVEVVDLVGGSAA